MRTNVNVKILSIQTFFTFFSSGSTAECAVDVSTEQSVAVSATVNASAEQPVAVDATPAAAATAAGPVPSSGIEGKVTNPQDFPHNPSLQAYVYINVRLHLAL